MNWISINDVQKPTDHEIVVVLCEWFYTELDKHIPKFMRTTNIAQYVDGEFHIDGEAEPAVKYWLRLPKVPDAPVDFAGYSHSEQTAI